MTIVPTAFDTRVRRSPVFDLLAGAAIAAAMLSAVHDLPAWGAPAVLFVSPAGADAHRGDSRDAPLRSIQTALRRIAPGGRVVVLPGRYQERLHLRRGGAPGAPLTLEAETPGAASVAWSCPLIEAGVGTGEDDPDGVSDFAVRWPIYELSVDGAAYYRVPFGGEARLRELARRPGTGGAFAYLDGRLLVAWRGGQPPALEQVLVNRRVPEPREWGEMNSANLWIEADHVAVRGLRFEFGVGAGITLWNAEHVLIEDCAFSGAVVGVKAGQGLKPSRQLTVSQCLYHHFPQAHWRRGWLSWDEVYAADPSSSLVWARDESTHVVACVAVHTGDSLRVTSREDGGAPGALIEGNLLALATDDAVEFDGPARHIVMRGNVVYECHESLGLSPVEQGPTTVLENLFLHEVDGINGAQLKLLGTRKPASANLIQNVDVHGNVFLGHWLCWWNESRVADVHVAGNVFCVSRRTDPPWPPGVEDVENIVLSRGPAGTAGAAGLADELRGVLSAAARPCPTAVVRAFGSGRPGPHWWNWRDEPATKEIDGLLNNLQPLLSSGGAP